MEGARGVLLINGVLVVLLGLAMLAPMLVDLAYGHRDYLVFLSSAAVTVFAGGAVVTSTFSRGLQLNVRQAFILTTSVWVVLPAFAALPFLFCELRMSYTDSYFEAMSGLTTTGSTVIVGLDGAPPGILIWRAILQWLGGVGIIVTAIAVLPVLRVGGMQLFRTESSEKHEKDLPRAAQIAAATVIVYVILSIACTAALWFAGLSAFDAIAHAMTTVATGGFSTSDSSVGGLANAAAEWIIIVFMTLSAMPFILYLQVVRGRPAAFWRDTQVRWFLATIAGATALVLLLSGVRGLAGTELEAVRLSAFNTISVITGTGYASGDYGGWGRAVIVLFFFYTFIGGCAGSTSCGIKIFRFRVMFESARVQIHQLVQPNAVMVPRFNGRALETHVIDAVMSFFFLFAMVFGVLAFLLTLTGLDMTTALSGAATAVANVGPGLGDIIGPAGTFKPLPDSAKWMLAAGMLLGRLELFTVLVLFTRRFWRT
ncbi:TrkH family potassium uptake protein [Minwuia thermotolerans]|uniref:Trk system potassium uptake protein n=1 Tax=Minwuia thermotolerans TaxID=2056226 RepID=A0A2M9G0Y8_9PROT|nr:TrkH family potassium uptake protein [Minwuia thermotolerans]PJK29381.1 potassium transporter TrkH [Minwuia thermotolerans]